MACDQNANRVTKSGTAAGIPAASSKGCGLAGVMAAGRRLDRAGQMLSTVVSPAVAFLADSQKMQAGRSALILAGGVARAVGTGAATYAVAGPEAAAAKATKILERAARQGENPPANFPAGQKSRRRLGALLKQLAVERISAELWSRLAEATTTGEPGLLVQETKMGPLAGRAKMPVWQSSLTGWLNRLDVIGRPDSQAIVASDGKMLQVKGITWHRGTTTVDMPTGQRTITHLQSLKRPASHHFFDRPLADEQAAGIAGGRLKPEAVPGYVGSISARESLLPAWAAIKRAMILTRLHWAAGKMSQEV